MRGEFQESTWQAFWQTAVEGKRAREVAAGLGMTIAAVYMAKSRVHGPAEGARPAAAGELTALAKEVADACTHYLPRYRLPAAGCSTNVCRPPSTPS